MARKRLSGRDPVALVRIKTLAAGTLNLLIALATGGELPRGEVIAHALLLGAFSYGVSVVLDTYGLRLVGAAREAAYFATAPFIGALSATVILDESLRVIDVAAMTLMILGHREALGSGPRQAAGEALGEFCTGLVQNLGRSRGSDLVEAGEGTRRRSSLA